MRDLPEIEVFAPLKPPIGPVEQTLIEARELISTPEKWCQGALHRSGKYCALGALCALDNPERPSLGNPDDGALRALIVAMDGDIPSFNNSHTHADVTAAFDRAIALAHSEGA